MPSKWTDAAAVSAAHCYASLQQFTATIGTWTPGSIAHPLPRGYEEEQEADAGT